MTKKKPANAPAYEAFHIPEREGAPWTRIGAAWTHLDGDGYTLNLDLIPATGGRIVLRKYEPKQAGKAEPEAGA